MSNLFRRRLFGKEGTCRQGARKQPTLGLEPLEDRSTPATFNVTNLNDSGAGSLRQAIADANVDSNADIITFQTGLTGQITLTTGQLEILKPVDIQGPGAAALTVSGNNTSRVFRVYDNTGTTIPVTISGLTVTKGSADRGGGIYNLDAGLTLDRVVITQNNATNKGGGLHSDGFRQALTIRNCTISGNTAAVDGGGIYNEDTLTNGVILIQNTVISNNQAGDDGGGIYFYDPDESLTIENCTISGNTAVDRGGGIYLYNFDQGGLTLRNTTISGNSAARGGGIFLYSPLFGFAIENCTISGNHATAGDGGGIYLHTFSGFSVRNCTIVENTATGTAGGIFVATGTLPLESSIVANNTAGTNNDLGGPGTFSLKNDLVEDRGIANVNDISGNLFGQDPLLGPLANNGGPTQTHALLSSSPAINKGSNPADLATDQRGSPRIDGVAADIGAFELLSLPTVLSINRTTPTGPTTNATSVVFTVTFSESVSGVDAADFALALSGVTATTPVSVSGSGDSYTVTVSGISGNGTLGLNLVDDDSIVDSDGNKLGGTGTGNGNLTGQVYTIDQTTPTTSITAQPTNPTNSTSAAFSFTGSDPTSGGISSGVNHLETKLDNGSYATATSPQSFSNLSEGSHTFWVRAVDNAGNVGSETSYTWVVDTTAPTASITAQPTNPTNSTSAAFSFTGSDPTSGGVSSGVNHLETKLDNGSYATVTSPQSFSNLSEGSHTFWVRAVDNAGNVGGETSYTWVVDTTAPTVKISTPSSSSVTAGSSVTFTITYADANAFGPNPSTLRVSDITLLKTGTANGTITVDSSTGTTRTVTITNITGVGTLKISLAPNTAHDAAGNQALGAGPSEAVTVRPSLRFDMKSSTKAPPTGWNSVLATTAYSATTGFGWLSTTGLKGITAPVPSPLPPGTDATMYGDAVFGTGSATFRVFVGVGQTATVRVHSYLPFVALPVYLAGANVSVTGGSTGTVRSPLSGGTQLYVDVRGQADANGFLDVTVSVPTGHLFWAVNGLEIIPST